MITKQASQSFIGLIAGLAAASLIIGCNSSTDATHAIPTKKAAKNLYKDAKPTDCPTFAKELQLACSDIIDKRLKLPCSTHLMQLEMAQEQAGGQLFDVGDAAKNQQVGSALCRKGASSLREARTKAEQQPASEIAWSPKCDDYFAALKADCLTRIANGSQMKHCRQSLQMLEMAVGGNNDGAMSCVMGAKLIIDKK